MWFFHIEDKDPMQTLPPLFTSNNANILFIGVYVCYCETLVKESDQTVHTPKPLLPNLPFLPNPLFHVVRPFTDWIAPFLLKQHNSPPHPSKFYSPIHELILLISGQCINPGPSYPCLVYLRPYIKSKFSYKYSNYWSLIHHKSPVTTKD